MSFPLILDLNDRLCLVVGQGEAARYRVERLLKAGARVRWVSLANAEQRGPTLAAERVECIVRPFEETDLDDCWLAILADQDQETARSLQVACEQRRVFFCAIDQPEFNSFSHVAIVEQSPLLLTVSSGGQVPALVRRVRLALEQAFADGRLAAYSQRLAALRAETPREQRKSVLERALRGFELSVRLVLPGSNERQR